MYIICIFLVPLELSVMRKEYFNQWYSLNSYYISVTLVDLPIQVCSLFIIKPLYINFFKKSQI